MIITLGGGLLAYLAGSIPWGLLLSRTQDLDIRTVGSGNIGATNVARNLGKRMGAVVLLLDAAKGAAPVLVALYSPLGPKSGTPYFLTIVGVAAIIGHCFPIWLRFRGGKGVATSLGVFMAVDPVMALIGIGIFAAVYAAFRVASLGSISAAAAFPVIAWVFARPDSVVMLALIGALIVIAKHHANIRRLLTSSELGV